MTKPCPHLLRVLLAGALFLPAAAIPAPAHAEPPHPRLVVQESPLAGFQFHQGPVLEAAFSVGDRLQLQRDRDHPADPRAVAVYWGQFLIGYLPAADTAVVAPLLDHGARLSARIVGLRPGAPGQQLRLQVSRGA